MTIHLSIVLFLPLATGLLGAFLPRGLARWAVMAGTVAVLAYVVAMLVDFESAGGLQWVTDDGWIADLGIRYSLGVDGINMFMIALTAIAWVPCTLVAAFSDQDRPRLFFFNLALAETAVLGAFMAQDLALFVAFFDLMLVPFLFLMLGWGGPERRSAVLKMIIYTLVGSLVMLAAAVATAALTSDEGNGQPISFVLSDLVGGNALNHGTQRLLFAGFALAFLIKMPAFLVQGWMPDTYRQLPMPALAVFSAVLSKVAAYGFLRVAIPLFPDAAQDFQLTIMIVSVAGILYGSAMAFTQTNLRLILGYSSLAQLSFITLGIFALNEQGAQGAIMQSVNHGLVVLPFFFIVMLAAERSGGSEDVRELGGVAFRGPVLATLALIVAFATLAIPGSANFVGEFYILLGAFNSKIALACIAFVGVAMASVYVLRAYIRTFHNLRGQEVSEQSPDISLRDKLVLVPLVVAILAFGLYPQGALEASEQAIAPRATQVAAEPGAARAAVPFDQGRQP